MGDDGRMAIGGSRGQRRAAAALVRALLVGALLLGGACAQEIDRTRGLDTAIAGLSGVSDSEVVPATPERVERIGVVLDRGLDAAETLSVVRAVAAAAHEAGSRGYVLEVSRSLVEDDVLLVDETFARDRAARGVIGNWIRLLDALLGEITYSYGTGSEEIAVLADGAIGHDVEESSRIGYGLPATTWRFLADGVSFVVSGRVGPRDVALFDRVQRTVTSSVLPVPATGWELQRRSTHVSLFLDVTLPGGDQPERITLDRWADDVEPLALAAVSASRYGERPRWVELTDVAGGAEGARDTFATWSSETRPVKGRDRYLRGWDQWWRELTR